MIAKNLKQLNERIVACAKTANRPRNTIQLVAVSKRFPCTAILEAIEAGHTVFGENYVQELQEKEALSGDNCKFHFIGHLQSNKAKHVARTCSVVETIDRFKLARLLDKYLLEFDRTMEGLIQINIGRESQKSGVMPEDAEKLLQQASTLQRLKITGVMTIPPAHLTPEDSRPHFRELHNLANNLHKKGLFGTTELPQISMGMSGDFHIAIEEGATIIRVGTAIFGQRSY